MLRILGGSASILHEAEPRQLRSLAEPEEREDRKLKIEMTNYLQGKWPLSAAQKGIWLGQQLDRQSPLYNTAECVEIPGELDPIAFERSLRQTVAEAETLNLRFDDRASDPMQFVDPNSSWSLQHLDFSSNLDPAQAARDWMEQDLKQTIDLKTDKPFSQALIKIASDRHFWYQRLHHIAIDGYGTSLLLRRMSELYTALVREQQIPPSPFGRLQAVLEEDFAYQTSEQKQRDRAYWIETLENAPDPVSLSPKIAPASAVCLRHSHTLSPETCDRLQAAAREIKSTWPDLLLAVTAVYLYRVTGVTDVILGLPMMGRLGSAALRVPAMVMNIVPLRVRLLSAVEARVSPGSRFSDLVAQISQTLRDIRPHHRYRYEQLRRDLKRVGGGRRLFGPVVNIMPFDTALYFGSDRAIVRNISAGPVEDLAFNIRTRNNGRELEIDLDANPACYSLSDLSRHQQEWLAELHSVIEDCDRVIESINLPKATLEGAEGTLIKGEPLHNSMRSVLEKFIERAGLDPHAEAVVEGGSTALTKQDASLSYSELLGRSRSLGAKLVAAGVKSGGIVAICLPRGCDAIVAILGVLFSGAAYLALDPEAPTARNISLLEDARPVVLIANSWANLDWINPDGTNAACRGDSRIAPTNGESQFIPNLLFIDRLDRLPSADTLPPIQDDTLAYLVYTSGSTGKPKGVAIAHSALAAFVSAAIQRYDIEADDRVLQFAALHFDASVEEIFSTLCRGATLVVREESMLRSIPNFLRTCDRQQITVLDLPTAFWHELAFSLANGQATLPASVRTVIIGGEAAHPERIRQWHSAVSDKVTLLNTYGPSETTVVAVVADLKPGCVRGGEVPIGYPLPGVDAAVLDPDGYPVPPGEEGELYILGPTLARGYWGREDLTADRFVGLSHFGDRPRAYRTGDRVFLRPDGQLVFVGRLDDEFKISGHRIDPSEIEAVLSAIPSIREAAVVGYELSGGIKRLCAYLVATDPQPSVQHLRQHLAEVLPAAAIPAGFNFVEMLPKTSSGKVDRRALGDRAPDWLSGDRAAAISPLEAAILDTWETILGQPGLTVQDDFFEWGGQSLQTIQVANWLGAKLNCEIEIATLFRYPTAAQLARALSSRVGVEGDRVSNSLFAPLFPITKASQPPLFCIHPAAGIAWCYMGLAKHLGSDRTLYGLQSPYLEAEMSPSEESWGEIVDRYLALVRQVQSRGPYRFLGWSVGGAIAQAMATRLQQQGEEIEQLILLDAYPSHCFQNRHRPQFREVVSLLLQATGQGGLDLSQIPDDTEAILTQLRQGPLGARLDRDRLNVLLEVTRYNIELARRMPTPELFQGDLIFFTAQKGVRNDSLTHQAWQPFVTGAIANYNLDTEHGRMLTGDSLEIVARAIALPTNTPSDLPWLRSSGT